MTMKCVALSRAKWVSADGRVLTYVFSGNDLFSLRQATLSLKATTTGFGDSNPR